MPTNKTLYIAFNKDENEELVLSFLFSESDALSFVTGDEYKYFPYFYYPRTSPNYNLNEDFFIEVVKNLIGIGFTEEFIKENNIQVIEVDIAIDKVRKCRYKAKAKKEYIQATPGEKDGSN